MARHLGFIPMGSLKMLSFLPIVMIIGISLILAPSFSNANQNPQPNTLVSTCSQPELALNAGPLGLIHIVTKTVTKSITKT